MNTDESMTWKGGTWPSSEGLGTVVAQPRKPCKGSTFTASNEAWESKKPVIEHLYLVKNLNLSQVAEIMEMAHGFKAT
jgi:hypothetical protein